MNGFKRINDTYGHTEGDEALKATGRILTDTIGSLGSVVRYAGDEFIVLLNTHDLEIAEQYIQLIYKNFETYNETSGKPYRLSAAAGYSIIDLKTHTVDELLHEVDMRMYENKRVFYNTNPSEDRRLNQ